MYSLDSVDEVRHIYVQLNTWIQKDKKLFLK